MVEKEVGESSFESPSSAAEPSDASYSPAQASFSPTESSFSLTEASTEVPFSPQFTDEEMHIFQRRYDNGYDLDDPRYSHWLNIFHPQENNKMVSAEPSDSGDDEYQPASYTSCLSKFLVYPLELT